MVALTCKKCDDVTIMCDEDVVSVTCSMCCMIDLNVELLEVAQIMINGIKPTMTKTTELRIKPTSFDEAMVGFLLKLEENVKPHVDKFNHMKSVTFGVDGGKKYIKVKYWSTTISKDYETGVETTTTDKRGSIHCFVESTTGDIFKPAGWKTPYLKGMNCVRGNIYDSSTFEKTDLHGGWLYAK